MEQAASTHTIPEDLENLDLLRETTEISSADGEHAMKIKSMLKRASKQLGTSRSKKLDNAGSSIPYEKQKHVTPFQEIDEPKRCNEFVVCGIMSIVLFFALLAFFVVIVYFALHPVSPSIALRDIINGTITLVTDPAANQTYVNASMVLSMEATNPRPKALTTIHYRDGKISVGYQKQFKELTTPSFDQAAQNITTTFVVNMASTRLGVSDQMVHNASLEFYQKNISMWIVGSVPAEFRIVGGLLSPHVNVSFNCSMKINPIDIWSGRPDLLSKTCQP